jgi:large subunit ribosomal protein L3
MNVIFGKKAKQTQAFLTDGTRIPVSVVEISANTVMAVKTQEKHGYTAIQVGFGIRKKPGKTLLGMAKKANLTVAPSAMREVRVPAEEVMPSVGEVVSVDAVLKAGDIVKVSGISKGKGFAGVVKRHNFKGGPRTHGQSDRERAPGSIGQTTTPGRVYRGKRMAGRMGYEEVSITNLQIIAVTNDKGKNTVLVKGLIPGATNTVVRIEKTGELSEKKYVPLLLKEEPVTAAAEVVTEQDVKEEKLEETASNAAEEQKTDAVETKEIITEDTSPEIAKEEVK